jgi:hypothetical protein
MIKPIIFVATYPSEKYNPDYMPKLEEVYTALHPAYDWESIESVKIKEAIGGDLPEWNKNPWKYLQERDYWAISKSELVVFDIDANVDYHFLGAAVIFKKPIICVSNILRNAYAYFSPKILMTIKPEDLLVYIELALKKEQSSDHT